MLRLFIISEKDQNADKACNQYSDISLQFDRIEKCIDYPHDKGNNKDHGAEKDKGIPAQIKTVNAIIQFF